ncbi:MAG: sigma-70 family RNA polymerase sigma factor [Bacteroidota bacterium]
MVTTVQTLDLIDIPNQRQLTRQETKVRAMNSSTDKEAKTNSLVSDCKQGTDSSYEILYKHYYSYAMNICFRYSGNMEEAKELLNDGFLQIFSQISSYDYSQPFESWLSRIMIDAAVDRYHKERKQRVDKKEGRVQELPKEGTTLDELSYYEILKLAQQLTATHRMVFCMCVIDGYSHAEIAKALNMSVNMSESNLLEARSSLKRMLKPADEPMSACVNF